MIGCLLVSEPSEENTQQISVINKNYDNDTEEVESQSISKNIIEDDINSLGVR